MAQNSYSPTLAKARSQIVQDDFGVLPLKAMSQDLRLAGAQAVGLNSIGKRYVIDANERVELLDSGGGTIAIEACFDLSYDRCRYDERLR